LTINQPKDISMTAEFTNNRQKNKINKSQNCTLSLNKSSNKSSLLSVLICKQER
jgi:hypothetical protein